MNDDVPAGLFGASDDLDSVGELRRRSHAVLGAVATLLGEPDLASQATLRDPQTALGHAESKIIQQLTRDGDRMARARLAAALSQVGSLLARHDRHQRLRQRPDSAIRVASRRAVSAAN